MLALLCSTDTSNTKHVLCSTDTSDKKIIYDFCSLEKLNWGAPTGKAKVTGTILGLVGALVLVFYKGVEFDIWPFKINLLDPEDKHIGHVTDTTSELLGVLCVVISCFCFSIWLIIQAKISEVYPCPQSSIALMSVIGTIQCVILGFIVERDLNQWKLGWDIRLLTVAFSVCYYASC